MTTISPQQGLDIIHELNSTAIFLIGGSFIMGCTFTLLLLVLFDWMRMRNIESTDK